MPPDELSCFLDSAPDWRKYFVPPTRSVWRNLEPMRLLESVNAVSRDYADLWKLLDEMSYRDFRHQISLALAVRRALAANRARKKMRRGSRRTRAQRPADSLHPAGDTQRLALYVDMVARRWRIAPLPKLLSLKDQVAATAASLARISLDAPFAACGVEPPFLHDTTWCSPHCTASMDVERVFAVEAVADAIAASDSDDVPIGQRGVRLLCLRALPPGEPLVLAQTGDGAKRKREDVSRAWR
jgi:hypothetical protein